jgi:phosphopantothenoylcysteine decarboxylase/phosphopantothenate--cysteine ligase
VGEVVKFLTAKRDLEGRSILVTSGRTQEPLDPVRYLSNRSSGKMGYALAEAARRRGAKITLISGPSHLPVPGELNFVRVERAREMYSAVRTRFARADVLIMAAAVSDFVPSVISPEKTKKKEEEINLRLKPGVDILKEMGKRKKKQILVGFSLETQDEIRNSKRKLTEKNLDLVVINNPTIPGAGFEVDTNRVILIDKKGKVEKLPLLPKKEVAERVLDKVTVLLKARRKK